MASNAHSVATPADLAELDPLTRRCIEISQDPEWSRRTCFEQGKAFVYLSDDRRHIVTEMPDGAVKRRAFNPEA